MSVVSGLTATGVDKASALALSVRYTTFNITTVAAGTGVLLPLVPTGTLITVVNSGANSLIVYDQLSGTNTVPTNSALSLTTTNGLSWVVTGTSAGTSTSPVFSGLQVTSLAATNGVLTSSSTGVVSSTQTPIINTLTVTGLAATNGILTSSVAGVVSSTPSPVVSSINFGGSNLSTYTEVTSFLPAVVFSLGSPNLVHNSRSSVYTRIGNIVTYSFDITFIIGAGASGALTVTLPIPVKAGTFRYSGSGYIQDVITATGFTYPGSGPQTFAQSGGTSLSYITQRTAAQVALIDTTNFASTSDTYEVQGSLTYQA